MFVSLTFGSVSCFDLCLHRYTLELDLFRNNQIGFAAVCMAGICNVNRPLGRCNQDPSMSGD